jgi:hypothetical protein
MKKFSLNLLIMFLVFHTGKVYAVDRAVVGYIISHVWYNNIFLIADKKNGMAYQNFTVQIGDGGGHEELYHFPNWYNSKFSPGLYYEDINGDELKDIIVVLISGAGTGISTKEIHVLSQVQDPYRRYEELPVESINDAVERLVKMKRKGNEITISIGKKKYVVDYSKFGYYTPVDSPGVGSIEDYKPKEGILYGSANVFVTIPEANIGRLDVKYAWNGKMYKAESITFEAKPYKQLR